MRCQHCDAIFEAKTVRRQFCSAKCRKAAWQRKRADRESRQRELIKALAKAKGMTAEDFA